MVDSTSLFHQVQIPCFNRSLSQNKIYLRKNNKYFGSHLFEISHCRDHTIFLIKKLRHRGFFDKDFHTFDIPGDFLVFPLGLKNLKFRQKQQMPL